MLVSITSSLSVADIRHGILEKSRADTPSLYHFSTERTDMHMIVCFLLIRSWEMTTNNKLDADAELLMWRVFCYEESTYVLDEECIWVLPLVLCYGTITIIVGTSIAQSRHNNQQIYGIQYSIYIGTIRKWGLSSSFLPSTRGSITGILKSTYDIIEYQSTKHIMQD